MQDCKIVKPNIERGDRVPCSLRLPLLTPRDALVVGIYSFHPYKDNVVPELWREVPLVTRVLKKPSWKVRTSSGAMSDLDEVYELQRWRQTNVKFASMTEHEPLPADVLYIAEIRFKDVATSYLPICPRLGDMVIKAKNEGFGYAGWQLACLLACGAASFDIALIEHVTLACDRDKPALIRLLTVLDDLDGFLAKLRKCLAGVKNLSTSSFC